MKFLLTEKKRPLQSVWLQSLWRKLKKNSKDTGNTSLYFTTLILMQVLSQEALDHIDSETYRNIWKHVKKRKKACRINSDRFFLHDVRRSNNCFSFFCFIITQIKMLFCTCHCDIKQSALSSSSSAVSAFGEGHTPSTQSMMNTCFHSVLLNHA